MNTHVTSGLPKKSMEDLWLTPSHRFKVGKYTVTVIVFGLTVNVSNIQLSRLKPFVISKTKILETTTIPSHTLRITLFTITL